MTQSYPTAGSSMLPTWNTTKEPVNVAPNSSSSANSSQNQSTYSSPGNYNYPQPRPSGTSSPGNYNYPQPRPTGGGTSTPPPAPTIQAPTPPSGPSRDELDAAYNPLLDYLGKAESQLRSDLPSYQQEINNQAATSRDMLGLNRQSTLNTLQEQQGQGQRRKEESVASSRQLFNELTMANNQRFGGATSAGQAASELQGREFQRSSAQAQQGYEELARQLDTKRVEVENTYQVSLRQIEEQKQAKLNEFTRQFQEKLLEINRQRTGVESEKAGARLAALDQYKQQVFQIQLQNYQFQQQLEGARQQAMLEVQMNSQQLNSLGQGGASMLSDYSSATTTSPETSYGVKSGYGSQSSMMTGQISNDDYLRSILMAGRIPGSSTNDPRYLNYQQQPMQ